MDSRSRKIRLRIIRQYCELLIFLSICSSCTWLNSPTDSPEFEFPTEQKNIFLVSDCKIINSQGAVVRKWPFDQCQFLDDGGMIAQGSDAVLSHFDKNGRLLWAKNIRSHHMFSLSLDKKTILVFGSEDTKIGNDLYRTDVLYRINLAGEILSEWRVKDDPKLLQQLTNSNAKLPRAKTGERWFAYTKADLEFSHANSIYEIPPNSVAQKIPAFQSGNILVNLNTFDNRFFIFDPTLQKVLWTSELTQHAHDAQVMPNGKILFFSNWMNSDAEASSIKELDPLNNSIDVKFSTLENGDFQSSTYGTVQKLRGQRYLVSFNDRKRVNPQKCEIHVVDITGKSLWRFENERNQTDPKRCPPVFVARVQDLSAFLANNRY